MLILRVLCALAVSLLATPLGLAQSPTDQPTVAPHWIWSSTHENCVLERSILLEQRVQSATLRFAADFCEAQVEINGQPVLRVEPYSPTVEVDVTNALLTGENRIKITATGIDGPPAIACSLIMTTVDGQHIEIISDNQWQASSRDQTWSRRPAVSLGEVEHRLWGVGRRSAAISPFDNYEQWRHAIGAPATSDKSAFWTPPGFEISLIRAAQPDEGSWISMAFDPQGRVTISREDKGLLRMTLDEPHSSVTKVETINEDLQECRGLLYAYGALYANANNSKGMYRLRDTDGDDRFDEVKLLREFPGGPGHGRNDLALGPDGLIYAINGDAVDVAKTDVIDYTSPFRDARRNKNTKEGYLIRTDRDGSKWELLSAGLRNPYGIAFNSLGDLFTYDADAEFDMGSPWYRPTRVNQLVSGADFGWRGVTGKWPPYFPDHADNALPALDIGRGSPTAVAFGTGTRFPEDYQKALFILDWSYGRILAVHMVPRGAGYRAWAETFLQGRPLNVTDITVGPDGALWIITGGRKTQSALYRITYTGGQSPRSPLSAHEEACQRHAAAARGIRRQLEAFHRPLDVGVVPFAWTHLDSPDPSIRYAARIAIEHQISDASQFSALRDDRPMAAFTALLALTRSGEKSAVTTVLDQLTSRPLIDRSLEYALLRVQAYFLCLSLAPDEVLRRKDAIIAQLDSLFPYSTREALCVSRAGTSASLNRDLARLLAEVGSPTIVEKVTKSLLISPTQEDPLQGLFVLRNVNSGWTHDSRRAYFTALNEASSFIAGEGMPKFLDQIREQAVATLTDAERESLADLLTRHSSAEDEPLPPARPLVKQWTIDDFSSSLESQASGLMGDPARGANVFRDALCSRCHRAGARGPAVGPDLTHVAGRFSPHDMLESILTPNKVVAENYRNVQINTTDGRQISGRLVMEGDFRLERMRIATDPLRPSAVVEISKREIENYRESETSPMPQGLLDTFTKQEVLDLLAFLRGGAP